MDGWRFIAGSVTTVILNIQYSGMIINSSVCPIDCVSIEGYSNDDDLIHRYVRADKLMYRLCQRI